MKKGEFSPHVNLILDLYAEGFSPWQISMWYSHWTWRYVQDIIVSHRRKPEPDTRVYAFKGRRKTYSLENFMAHQPRFFVGMGYKCLRCKSTCDAESDFDLFKCTGTEEQFGKNKRGRGSPNYDPMKRLKHGRKHYKNG